MWGKSSCSGVAPMARIDLPTDHVGREAVAKSLAPAYAGGGVPVLLLAYTSRRDLAEEACESVRSALVPTTPVVAMAAVEGQRWVRLDEPDHGIVRQSDHDRLTAESLYRGGPAPFASMAAQRASFEPSERIPPDVMSAALEATAVVLTDGSAQDRERSWVADLVQEHAATRAPLSDPDAARLLSDVQDISFRDLAWRQFSREEGRGHAELWKSLLTRAPEGLESPPAALAAFSYWFNGDGMSARLALERIPEDQSYSMARIVDAALRHHVDPRTMPLPGEAVLASEHQRPSGASPSRGADAERRLPPPQSRPHGVSRVGR